MRIVPLFGCCHPFQKGKIEVLPDGFAVNRSPENPVIEGENVVAPVAHDDAFKAGHPGSRRHINQEQHVIRQGIEAERVRAARQPVFIEVIASRANTVRQNQVGEGSVQVSGFSWLPGIRLPACPIAR